MRSTEAETRIKIAGLTQLLNARLGLPKSATHIVCYERHGTNTARHYRVWTGPSGDEVEYLNAPEVLIYLKGMLAMSIAAGNYLSGRPV